MRIVNDVHAGMDYVKDGVLYSTNVRGGVMVETAADLPELPEYSPGTLAHTPGWKAVWERTAMGGWKNITGGEDIGIQ